MYKIQWLVILFLLLFSHYTTGDILEVELEYQEIEITIRKLPDNKQINTVNYLNQQITELPPITFINPIYIGDQNVDHFYYVAQNMTSTCENYLLYDVELVASEFFSYQIKQDFSSNRYGVSLINYASALTVIKDNWSQVIHGGQNACDTNIVKSGLIIIDLQSFDYKEISQYPTSVKW